ncbi:uncharacterized protein LOC125489032 [Plutella xylostella]|uniref:uncharacterized protein LOC125489032 n=1 Tax=Plutella xylostella TaxID=51655 RepID=UPI0020322183|nr:uncharacterized protein LOC125489032 [Plutella xylostella]
MLLQLLFSTLHLTTAAVTQENGKENVRLNMAIPMPMQMPNRNDRADQCWLRVEDADYSDTVTLFCYIANAFLKDFFYEYNKKKSAEEGVNSDSWNIDPRDPAETTGSRNFGFVNYQKPVKDWRSTSVLDPTTHRRIYVSQKADCRIIMYSREAMSNYRVDCQKVLFFINERATGRSVILEPISVTFVMAVFLVLCIM